MTNLSDVVRVLKQERDRLTKQVEGISAALAAFGTAYTSGTRRKMSEEGRAKIAAAQRARWAKIRAKNGKPSGTAPKRVLSAAARKRIAAAQRARWAKLRAAA